MTVDRFLAIWIGFARVTALATSRGMVGGDDANFHDYLNDVDFDRLEEEQPITALQEALDHLQKLIAYGKDLLPAKSL